YAGCLRSLTTHHSPLTTHLSTTHYLIFVQQLAQPQNLFSLQRGVVADVEAVEVHVVGAGILLVFITTEQPAQIRLAKLVAASRCAPPKLDSVAFQQCHDPLAQDRVRMPENQ